MTTTDDVYAALAGGSTLIPRDRWGRPLITPPEGGKPIAYTRCTTYVGAIDDLYGLMGWKQRQTAVGIAARKDLLLRVASLGPQPVDEADKRRWKAQMDEAVEAAMEAAGSSAAATTGTALHAFTEAVDQGHDPAVPDDYRPHLDAYKAATAHLEVVGIEQFLVRDDLRVGGTADRIYRVPGVDGLVIGDIKTGSIDYPHKMAMQLAMYANSEMYDPETGARSPGDFNRDRGIIIHLDATTGATRLLWVDLRAGWDAIRLAGEVRAWRARKDLTSPYTTRTPEAIAARAQAAAINASVDVAIANATSTDELMRLAEQARATGAWTEQHNHAAAARWAALSAA